MALIQIATPFNIDIDFEIAEFHKRLLAYCIDFIILLIYLYSLIYLYLGGFELDESANGFILITILIPMLFYTFVCELLLNGQTIGKKVMQIRVVSLNGGEPTMAQYLLRWFLRFYEWGFIVMFLLWQNAIAGFMVLILGGFTSIVIMAITKKNQRLGDIAADTVIVNTRSKLTVDDTIFMHVGLDYQVKFPEVLRLTDRDINTIKSVLTQAKKNNNYDMCNKAAAKVQKVLKIPSDMYANEFLEKLLEDYNYLATRE
ncbi:MAG TPA: RDD family protein [Ferruginibacter sp.]|nr:RDD family protein [Ferruginibacter sp.]